MKEKLHDISIEIDERDNIKAIVLHWQTKCPVCNQNDPNRSLRYGFKVHGSMSNVADGLRLAAIGLENFKKRLENDDTTG